MSDLAHVTQPESGAGSPSVAGVRGWLLLFTLGLLPHLALSGAYLADAMRSRTAGGPWLVLATLTLVGHGTGLALILRRHRLAPAFFTLYLPLSIAAALLTPGVGAAQAEEAVRLGMIDPSEQARVAASAPGRIALAVAVGALCLGYWLKSRRVRATFGSTGLKALRRS